MACFRIQKFVFFTVCMCLSSKMVSPQTLPYSDSGIESMAHPLVPGQPTMLSIGYHSTISLTLTGVSPGSRFVIVQVYTKHVSLMLNQTAPPPGDVWETGSGVGMVQMVSNGDTHGMVWSVGVVEGSVRGEEDFPVTVLALVNEYGDGVPVPGGCNQVFALEMDPNLRVISKQYHSEVWFQWASVATLPGDKPVSCEDASAMQRLKYEVYVIYTAETDSLDSSLFNSLKAVSTVQDMKKNAVKVITIENDGRQKSLVKVTSNQGQGSVFGVIVTDTKTGQAGSYVAAVTYACNYTAGDCSLHYDAMDWIMMGGCAVAGLILLLLGHQFIRTEMAVIGFIAVTLVSFIFLSMSHTLSDSVRLGVSVALGLVGGGGWLAVWMIFSFPSVSVLLPGLCAGFLVAASLFFTPFANISWWTSSLNYGLVLVCVTLLFGVVFLFSPRTLNIVSCSLVGGFCVSMVVVIPVRSSLQLIVLYVIRHASDSDFPSVITVSPFLTNDIILAVLWGLLTLYGTIWQFYRARGLPHFPTSSLHPHSPQRSQVRGHRGRGKPPSDLENPSDDERAPLLVRGQPQMFYHSSVLPPPHSAPPESNRPM